MGATNAGTVPVERPDKFYIGGRWVEPTSSDTIDVIDPATEQVYFSVAEARNADIAAAVGAARSAFDVGPWPRLTHAERAEFLRAIGTAVEERTEDVAQIWPRESGILVGAARSAMAEVSEAYSYYADLAGSFAFEEPVAPTGGGSFGLIRREPVGVVGAIVPWNVPMTLIAYKLAPALLAGCTVVLKASPEAPGAALVMAEIAERVGLPDGVLNVVTADREVSETLVRDPRVDKVAFTGSTAAGKAIAGIMAERVGRCSLELGGKSAAIVLDDADIAEAAAVLAGAECFLTGQICGSLTRIIVSRNRHDAMVESLAARFSQVRVGDPFDADVQMGPLATRRQRQRVEGYVEIGLSEGAVLAAGGGRPVGIERGWFVEPTVFGKVDNSWRIAQEEIFGPVLTVIPAKDEQDAVRIANDSIYGLNASVFTPDADRARAVGVQLRSGTVGHNDNRADFGIGFGGFKQSGIGREGGVAGLQAYLENKTMVFDERPAGSGG
ncbi:MULTISPECIES: aldehyde dehydrogenase [Pseudonocardia]|uniref:Geranial dehydrogenase n=2 Tax=Pseudonocardia TaxID=1847 RepID=A0A1Y2MQU4_PSEAH|nr:MULTISPECIES: aldehyde dehydrogenase [Pseudonocardia]OSY36878.1 Geranial dehydrogenase [Pseudonocardia autotrophica]TDN76868.1 acyl-CoA reductase-like NAD-dependent aldehyde dehydrogenase [Pseudonocardia autotrophica]GEC28863.1 aldehyde dehydrogenase [Pseudonocardia saturnea]